MAAQKVLQATIKNTRQLVMLNKATGTVSTKGDLLMVTAGLAVPATSSTVVADLGGLCNQTISAADALTQVETIVLSSEDTFLIDTTNNTNPVHNNQAMVLGVSASIANNTGTTSATGIVVQVAPFGVTGDRRIIARFVTL